ncbi:signal peptidase I [Pseudanabaena sp. 'Roaring Creek']|uniref:signal peptidase I n=1 Tax=Pseudanabaena sp. 'Roaring Creek' TaxID=1681830 RepID=UPI00092E3FC7|nr:signal peptidase I [Pseudanabaena sp. 'Roaring Creek']
MSSDNSSDRTNNSPVTPPTDPKQAPIAPKESSVKNFLTDNLPTVTVAILLAVGVRIFVAEPRFIPSSSMEPTLLIDDRLIIDKLSFRWRKPERGEIVVFNPPNNPVVPDASKVYIKRVIGLPGDRLSIHDGKVFVNDVPLNEPYIASPPSYTLPTQDDALCPNCFRPDNVQNGRDNYPYFTVPNGKYWVMGDNRNNSLDSHAWGFMPEENLVGRAMFRYWPFDKRAGNLNVPKY